MLPGMVRFLNFLLFFWMELLAKWTYLLSRLSRVNAWQQNRR